MKEKKTVSRMKKESEVKKLEKLLLEYNVIGILDMHKMPGRQLQKIRDKLNQKRAELAELLRETPPDQEKIKDKIREIASLQMQLQEETVNHLEKIKIILTPRQREKFFSLIRKGLHPKGQGLPPKRQWRKRF